MEPQNTAGGGARPGGIQPQNQSSGQQNQSQSGGQHAQSPAQQNAAGSEPSRQQSSSTSQQNVNSAAGYPRDTTPALDKSGEIPGDLADKAQTALDQTKQMVTEKATQARQRVVEQTQQARQVVVDRGQEAYDATDAYVRENPWRAVGIAGFVGLLTGLIIARK